MRVWAIITAAIAPTQPLQMVIINQSPPQSQMHTVLYYTKRGMDSRIPNIAYAGWGDN